MRKIFVLLATVFILLNIIPVKAMEKTSETLKKNVVTEGEGLYEDSTIEGRYIYKGGNPNNYIKLGNDLYRIISLESDGTIKVIKNRSIGEFSWDEGSARHSTNSEDFCASTYGCKSWGSNTTTLDSSGNKVTQMPWEVNGTLYNLPDKESTLNTYLNNDFYNNLDEEIKKVIVEKTWNIGSTKNNQKDIKESIEEESTYKWKGKIALMNVTDYVKASTITSSNVQYYWNNKDFYTNNSYYNYLYSNNYQWTLSPLSDTSKGSSFVFFIYSAGELTYNLADNLGKVRPTFYLSSNISLDGKGTENNPYKIIQENNQNIKNENETNQNVQIVDVPATSAYGSIIIITLGIICIISSTILVKNIANHNN